MTETNEKIALLPRRLIFGDLERSVVRVSGDGTRIAFRAPLKGILNLWVAPVDELDKARPVTTVTDRGIGPWVIWMHDDRHIVFFREENGDENWRLWRVDLQTADVRPLSPGSGVKCYVQEISHAFPGELLIAHNERDKRYFDIFRIDVATAKTTLVEANEGFFAYFSDWRFHIRYALRSTADGGREYLERDSDGGWRVAFRISAEDAMMTRMAGSSPDGHEVYWLDSRGRDTAAAVAHDLDSGATRVLAEDSRADLERLLLEPVTEIPIATSSTFERTHWQVLDPDYQEDFDYLMTRTEGDLQITSISRDRRRWIVAGLYDDAPMDYFLYDRQARQARRLFSNQPALEGAPLVPMEPVVIRARDGLELVCYLSRPHGPAGPLPMVLLVHGGPWNRDTWGIHHQHQWLANRGYAVLSVNFRGSTGFGKAFVNAANREWAGKMHDDLIDAVDWAIAEGIADPVRVAIMGNSYGGYAALVGLTFTPEKFACAVDLVGISSLVTFLDTFPDYWKPLKALWKARVGDDTTEEGLRFLQDRSPLHRADRIVRPLLIGQGANDVRVKASESEQIVAAMKRHGIPVTYVFYPDEGHVFCRPENRRSFAAVAEAFLAKHLGGRCEGIGRDFDGASIEFKAGRELIPGID